MRIFASLSRLPATLALVALVAIPLAANPYSARVFDPERAILLRLLALPALFALIATTTRVRRPNAIECGAWLYGIGSLASCFVSAAPAQAFAGDYPRQMGLLTDLALLAVFFAMRRVRERAGLAELAWKTATIGGAALGVLACVEAIATDGRASSISGGPTFLGSHLALLLPFAVATMRDRIDRAATIAIALGLLASGSRVATFAGALGVFVVAIARGGEFAKRLAIGGGAIVALVAALALPPIAARLPGESLPVRVGELFARHGGDLEQRMFLWRDAVDALASDPTALVLGRGPDSIGVAFSPFVSEELQRRLGGRLRVDRLHGDALDLLFTRGALGLAGMIVLLVAAIRAARRASDDPLALGFLGLLAAAVCDSLFSVPGVVSRLLVFAAAGLVAAGGLSARANESKRADDLPAGLLAGSAAIALLFAIGFDSRWIAALAFLAVTGRSLVGASLGFIVVGAIALARAICVVASDPSPPTRMQAEAQWLGLAAIILPIGLLAIATLFASFTPRRTEPGRGNVVPHRGVFLVLAAIGTFATIFVVRDDLRRILAESHARIATRIQHVARRPEAAVALLDRASELAPEVARYAMRAAIAQTDALDSVPADAKPALDAAFVGVSERVHACSLRAPRDAFLLAEGADVLLRVAERTRDRRALLVAHAMRLARPALELAPTALPVLQANARLDLALGNPDAALAHLRRALSIDNSPGLTHLLLGRAHAAKLDAQQAAFAYSLALPTGVGKLEALAGLALAAASIDGIEEAARLVIEMARVSPLPGDLRAAVEGARPLLPLVAWDRWNAVFEGTEANFTGDPRAYLAVRTALDY